MIFVAIGTTDFDALVRAMDELSLRLPEKVVMQIGRSKYTPRHGESFRFAPSLDVYYDQAALVVSHGGLGIVTEVMKLGRPLIAVEDPHQPDRHQRDILSVWEQEKHLLWCKELSELEALIERARHQTFEPYRPPECRIHTLIAQYLHRLEQERVQVQGRFEAQP